MKTALVIGSSGGIGKAIFETLPAQGFQATGLSRSVDGFDLRKPETIEAALTGFETAFDLVFVATGALDGAGQPPEKTVKALTANAMADQFAVNAIGPAMVLKQLPRLLPRDRTAHVAVLSARVGSIGDNSLGGWTSYRAAKAALNQVVRTTAIELARTHKQTTLVAMHPGTVETAFTANYQGRHTTIKPDVAANALVRTLLNLSPKQTGGFYDKSGQHIPW